MGRMGEQPTMTKNLCDRCNRPCPIEGTVPITLPDIEGHPINKRICKPCQHDMTTWWYAPLAVAAS